MITGKCCFACVREARGHVHDIDDVNGFDLWINLGIVRPDEPHHRSDTILLTSVIGSAVVPTLIAQLWFQRPCGAQRSPGHPLASLDWRYRGARRLSLCAGVKKLTQPVTQREGRSLPVSLSLSSSYIFSSVRAAFGGKAEIGLVTAMSARLRLRLFWHGGPRSKWIEYICPKTCMARTGPAMTRRKDRYQPRAASASQPKTLKTYACA